MYYANIPLTNPSDFLFVTYPGSGTTWLANIMAELGLTYIDGYTEKLCDKESARAEIIEKDSRQRTPSLDRAFKDRGELVPARIIKTHLWPEYFDNFDIRNVIMLVRDGRDSVYSYYKWRVDFSEEGESGSFSEFLNRPGFNGVLPLQDWALTVYKWKTYTRLSKLLILKFEDAKKSPFETVKKLLDFLNMSRSEADIAWAIDCSSFERMRAAEECAVRKNPSLGKGLIMRSGKPSQWKDAFSEEDLPLITGLAQEMLSELKYV